MRVFMLPTRDEALSDELSAMDAAALAQHCVDQGYEELSPEDLSCYGFEGGRGEDAERLATELMQAKGWKHKDEVHITPETPRAALDRFSPEHLHTDDEVRILSKGEGVFDVRADDAEGSRYVRLILEANDWISIPPRRYHRFWCTGSMKCSAIRLFADNPSWEPIYR